MPIVGLSDVDVGLGGAARSDCYGPGGIYHEKQVGALCGLHSVNNLLQGPHFTVDDLRAVAQELDRRERELTDGHGLDYGNASADGYYNVQVMQVVLSRAGCEMVPLKELPAEEPEKGWRRRCRRRQRSASDIAREKAFILNKHKHWFALRRIGKEWFDLNSCLDAPHHYNTSELRTHIAEAMGEGYAVFVVRGIFPACELEQDRKRLKEAVKGCREERPEDEDLPHHPTVLLLIAYFFGARQFDSFAPPARWVQELFTRRSFSETRRRKLELQGRACGSAVLPSRPPGASPEPDKLLRQLCPVFTVVQSLLAFGLCLSFSFVGPVGDEPAMGEAVGLESLLPGRTSLLVHRGCGDYRPEAWRWLSYQFSHGSVSDVGMSALLTLFFGISLEGLWGPLWTGLIFNLGVLGGAGFHMVLNAHYPTLVGMSPGTYAFIGLHSADLLLNWTGRRYGRLKVGFLVLMAGLDHIHLVASRKSRFDYWSVMAAAQGGGLSAGFLFGLALTPNTLHLRSERLLLATSTILAAGLVSFLAVWIAQWPPRTLLNPTPWCWARQVYNLTLFEGMDAWHCIRCQDDACIERWSRQQQILEVDYRSCDGRHGWHVTER